MSWAWPSVVGSAFHGSTSFASLITNIHTTLASTLPTRAWSMSFDRDMALRDLFASEAFLANCCLPLLPVIGGITLRLMVSSSDFVLRNRQLWYLLGHWKMCWANINRSRVSCSIQLSPGRSETRSIAKSNYGPRLSRILEKVVEGKLCNAV